MYKGLRVSVVSTGIGTDNMEIVVAEILAIIKQPDVHPHRLVWRAARGDRARRPGHHHRRRAPRGDHQYFVHDGYPAVADYAAVAALVEAAAQLGHTAHLGLTATAPGFYGAQGRPIPQLPIRYPDLAEEMAPRAS